MGVEGKLDGARDLNESFSVNIKVEYAFSLYFRCQWVCEVLVRVGPAVCVAAEGSEE